MSDYELIRLEAKDRRPDFSTGDEDLDEFYRVDSVKGCQQLLCVTYLLLFEGKAQGFFSVSNDAVRKTTITRSAFKRVAKDVPHEKRYESLPAVKIGRLGVSKDAQGKGVGSIILDFLKGWFTEANKTGCRFLLVDAYNREQVIQFYESNGFKFLVGGDEEKNDATRIMYYDLAQLK